mmetsp:Transcript_53410/g.152392  ORF Transcript_53410/g.152392 Transcript_53410/m.152392 type:complete len:414 (-) Transcript_53410:8-1249(-)
MRGRRAGALLCGLACAGALKTHVKEERKLKALYVTSSFPKDTMPIDVMVQHQLRSLSGPNVELRAVVFDNQPPWLEPSEFKGAYDLQHRGLLKLHQGRVDEGLPQVTVKAMDYAGVDEPGYLAPFFDVNWHDVNGNRLPQRSLREMYGTKGERAQMLSNFFAMSSFMKECMRPEHDDVDLCVYFDPDMLMYENTTGILELATATFEENPGFVVLSPPYGCFSLKAWNRKNRWNGACPSKSAIVSSRHVIAQRGRLRASLPLKLQPGDIGKQYWEVSMTEALGRTGRGQILCAQEFFIVHPPSRYQQNKAGAMSLRQLLKEMVPELSRCSESGTCSPEVEASLGTRELVRRFEAGMMTANNETMYNRGCGCCADMMPSAERIRAGEAFFQPQGLSLAEHWANDAAFDWVVKCAP